MAYVAYFHDVQVELDPGDFGNHGPAIVGDLLAVWTMIGERNFKYLIDGLEGSMTPIGTFEREVEAATFCNHTLLIATKDPAKSQSQLELEAAIRSFPPRAPSYSQPC